MAKRYGTVLYKNARRGTVLKVYRHAPLSWVANEFDAAVCAYQAEIATPEPLWYGQLTGKRTGPSAILMRFEEMTPLNYTIATAGEIATLAVKISSLVFPQRHTPQWECHNHDREASFAAGSAYLRLDKRMPGFPSDKLTKTFLTEQHGDFSSDNICLLHGRVGVCDFGLATLGPPWWDIGYLLAFFPPEAPFAKALLSNLDPDYTEAPLYASLVKLGRAIGKSKDTTEKKARCQRWIEFLLRRKES